MTQSGQASITHYGRVDFVGGEYQRVSGSTNWKVWPIEAFEPPIRAPVGQIEITFEEPIKEPYAVLVTAHRTLQTPMMAANCDRIEETGFVVHLFETIADRTVMNGGFSFAVLRDPS